MHYFTREWAKKHTVKVIRPYYYYEKEVVQKNKKVFINGVEVIVVKPIWFPIVKKSLISRKSILKLIDRKPDVIICHKNTAYLPFFFLKGHFNVPFIVGIHTTDILFSRKNLFKKRQRNVFKHTDLFAYRSNTVKKLFENIFQEFSNQPSFIANSGIPESAIRTKKTYKHSKMKRILYVGTLIDRKNADKILIALSNLPFQFEFTVIGEGLNLEMLKKLSRKLGIDSHVFFKGFIQRKQVFEEMDKHDYFVMPSINETFGLVYLEAMSRGMVVVGMRHTGIDGIIVDQKNGFLSENESQHSITSKIRQVFELNPQQQQLVIDCALKTVRNYTNKKAADYYLKQIVNLISKSM